MSQITRNREEEKFIQMMTYSLAAPNIFPNKWGLTVSDDTKSRAKLLRMAQVSKIFEEEMATKFDAMMYLSCMSLQAKMVRSAAKMYTHCYSQYYDLALISRDENELRDFKRDAELFEEEAHDLDRLRKYIFRQQVAHLK